MFNHIKHFHWENYPCSPVQGKFFSRNRLFDLQSLQVNGQKRLLPNAWQRTLTCPLRYLKAQRRHQPPLGEDPKALWWRTLDCPNSASQEKVFHPLTYSSCSTFEDRCTFPHRSRRSRRTNQRPLLWTKHHQGLCQHLSRGLERCHAEAEIATV